MRKIEDTEIDPRDRTNMSAPRKHDWTALRSGLALLALAMVATGFIPSATRADLPSVGSHIPDRETAVRPVHVIDREDIERSGTSSVHDMLVARRDYNNFGLLRPVLLGFAGTIVLINGRQIPYPPGNYILQSLPVEAVERIEFISDGAGSLHAGGPVGAINVMLRRNFEGKAVWGSVRRPDRKGGEIENAGAMVGGQVGRGNLTIGMDGFREAEIRSADRAYSRSSWTEGGSFADTTGVNNAGNFVYFLSNGIPEAHALGDCSDPYVGPLAFPFGVPGTGCGYPDGNSSWKTGRLRRESLFASLDHPIDDATAVYADVRFARGDTAFRSPPSFGQFTFEQPSPALLDQLSTATGTVIPSGQEVNVVHTFVAHGDQDTTRELTEYDLTAGLHGRLGTGVGYDMYLRSHRIGDVGRGGNYVSEELIRQAIVDGDYYLSDPLNPHEDRAAAHRRAIHATTVRLNRDSITQRRTARFALDGASGTLSGGPMRWGVGMEVDDLKERGIGTYRSMDGQTHEIQTVLGASGTSYSGKRLRRSAFGELRLPLHQKWTVALAGRHDRHDDVGPTWSRGIASVYRPHRILSLRGSWEIAKTPTELVNINASEAVYDTEICDTKNHTDPQSACETIMVKGATRGNPDLEPDRRENYTIGARASYGRFFLSTDWYRILIDGTPGQLSDQKIVDIEATGESLPPGSEVIREADVITRIVNPVVNTAGFEVSGFDVRAGSQWTMGTFDTSLDLRWLHLADVEATVGGIVQPVGVPRNRMHATLSVGWNDWMADWNARAVSDFDNLASGGRYKNWIGHDFGLTWRDPFELEGAMLRGGVFNVTDEGPSIDTSDPSIAFERRDAAKGRTFYLSLTKRW